MRWAQKQKGFTIVELLIVIVVIAILAAITIVAYNGITQRAKASTAQNGAQQAYKKLAAYAVDNADTYPGSLASLGFVNSGTITYQYSVNTSTSPQGYCVTANAAGVSYYLGHNYAYTGSSSGTINQPTPIAGTCPGHTGTGVASVTNLMTNPNIEVSNAGYGGPNGSTTVRDTSRAYQGSASMRATMPTNGSTGVVGLSLYQITSLGDVGSLQPNTTYTVSAYVYSPTGSTSPFITVQGSGRASRADPAGAYITSVKDQWVRIYNSFVTNASGNISLFILNGTPSTSGQQFWADNIMISEGVTTPYTYADGNSAGWVWNGSSGLSSSSGPML